MKYLVPAILSICLFLSPSFVIEPALAQVAGSVDATPAAPSVAEVPAAVKPDTLTDQKKVALAPDFDMQGSVVRMIQGLALCVGLLLVLVWLQKRVQKQRAKNGQGRSLEIIERLQTGAKTQVLLISVKGREYLVGQGSDSVNIYGEVVHEELEDDPVIDTKGKAA